MPRTKKRLVAAVHSTAYGLGHDAGIAMTTLLGHRQDHVTCSIEWYRGFCAGCGSTPEPKVEAYIAREALAVKHGLDRVAIILAGIEDTMNVDMLKLVTDDLPAGKEPMP